MPADLDIFRLVDFIQTIIHRQYEKKNETPVGSKRRLRVAILRRLRAARTPKHRVTVSTAFRGTEAESLAIFLPVKTHKQISKRPIRCSHT